MSDYEDIVFIHDQRLGKSEAFYRFRYILYLLPVVLLGILLVWNNVLDLHVLDFHVSLHSVPYLSMMILKSS